MPILCHSLCHIIQLWTALEAIVKSMTPEGVIVTNYFTRLKAEGNSWALSLGASERSWDWGRGVTQRMISGAPNPGP